MFDVYPKCLTENCAHGRTNHHSDVHFLWGSEVIGARIATGEMLVEVQFECGTNPGGVRRSEVAPQSHVKLERLVGTVAKTALGHVAVASGTNALCVNLKGTLLVRAKHTPRLIVCPPRSVIFFRHGRYIVQAARGEHEAMLINWTTVANPLLEHWISQKISLFAPQPPRGVACQSIDPDLQLAYIRFTESLDGNPEALEPMLMSFVYECNSRLLTGPDEVRLSHLPRDLPDTVRDLVKKVRQQATQNWPLKEAADLAGYSPFHFSRVFKNLVGYGFHEYVDRCRAERAVELLCTTDTPVDMIASTCGFGTTQGLRESIREYLGLVPSELRSGSEPNTTSD